LKGKPEYKSEPRYNYGAVDYYEGNHCISNILANIKPQSLADNIEGQLNDAIGKGIEWSKTGVMACSKRKDFKKCLIEEGLLEEK